MATRPFEDGSLAFQEYGDGLPTVSLPGGWGSSDAWCPQVKRFAEEGRVVIYDPRGHRQIGAARIRQIDPLWQCSSFSRYCREYAYLRAVLVAANAHRSLNIERA